MSFRYKNRARGDSRCVENLPAPEFLQRFLKHVVPRRFMRVRHYGILANRIRAQRLSLARVLLDAPAPPEPQDYVPESREEAFRRLTGSEPTLCPVCRRGTLTIIAELPRLIGPHARSP